MNKPHFTDIARDLTEAIVSNRFPVGTYLPTELELCDQYKTSRHTIRVALNELQQLGFVSRRKNAGTRVESTRPRDDFRSSLASIDDVVQFGTEHLRVVQSTEEISATGELAKILRCREGERWVRVSSLRVQRGSRLPPIGWTDVYIDPAYGDIVEMARTKPDTLINSLIEARYGRCVTEIQQNVQAITISPGMATRLKVEPGSPGLRIVRRYVDSSGATFEVSISEHPADRFSVSMRLRRSSTVSG